MQKMSRFFSDMPLVAAWSWWLHIGEKKNLACYSVFAISDDGLTLSTISSALGEEAYNFHSAMNVDDALRLLDTMPIPDVIICDFVKPEEDGKEFLKRVGVRLGKSAMPPLIFLMDTKEDEIAAHEFGAHELLLKPFEPQALLACIDKLVSDDPSQ